MIKTSTSAITYAKSLFEANKEALQDLNTVFEVMNSSKEFELTMLNPSVSLQVKYDIVDEIFKKELDEKVLNFVKILIEKNRFNEFSQIIQAYSDVLDEANNVKRVEIVSAIELSDTQKQKTINKLKAKLNKEVKVDWTLDTGIIGGLVIKIDDNIIDTSLKNKLDKLSKI